MLQLTDGRIVETANMTNYANMAYSGTIANQVTSCNLSWPHQEPHYFWQSYPIYVCTDKTAKAIEVLKSLEEDKVIELKSVKAFIKMVEKIAGIL